MDEDSFTPKDSDDTFAPASSRPESISDLGSPRGVRQGAGRVRTLIGEIDGLRRELTLSYDRLQECLAENERLAGELEAAENALRYTKSEVANLWRALTARNNSESRREVAALPPSSEVSTERALGRSAIVDIAQERRRIQGKIADVRGVARRRRWPWAQTS